LLIGNCGTKNLPENNIAVFEKRYFLPKRLAIKKGSGTFYIAKTAATRNYFWEHVILSIVKNKPLSSLRQLISSKKKDSIRFCKNKRLSYVRFPVPGFP